MIIQASAHQIPLADKSVHCVVTSPPYFGLRRYSGKQDVEWPTGSYSPVMGCPPCVEVPAMRASLGNEPTIEAFIWHLLLVMRELKRVLRDDGVCWVNLGDSFISAKSRYKNTPQTIHNQDMRGERNMRGLPEDSIDFYHQGYGDGNLAMVPHRFALAAQADGWTLRNDCVWHKKSAMPESVSGWKFQDKQLRRGSWRHTRAHEYVFQFVKGMGYWSDSAIVKEPAACAGDDRKARAQNGHKTMPNELQNGIRPGESSYDLSGRNPRSVFSPSPSPYSGAHFATFPKELIRPLILSSVPRRCCPECGQGWAAVVESKPMVIRKTARAQEIGRTQTSGTMLEPARSVTTGYAPTCSCGNPDLLPGDLEAVGSPTGERVADDPTMDTGRKGLNRERGKDEGARLITRYEQRKYAEQLKCSERRAEMESEAGQTAFAHYLRTDKSGARPIPGRLLTLWVGRGWLARVDTPKAKHLQPVAGIVLDPFVGSGTTLEVARECGVRAIGLDISHTYLNEQASWRGFQVAKPDFSKMPLFARQEAA